MDKSKVPRFLVDHGVEEASCPSLYYSHLCKTMLSFYKPRYVRVLHTRPSVVCSVRHFNTNKK